MWKLNLCLPCLGEKSSICRVSEKTCYDLVSNLVPVLEAVYPPHVGWILPVAKSALLRNGLDITCALRQLRLHRIWDIALSWGHVYYFRIRRTVCLPFP